MLGLYQGYIQRQLSLMPETEFCSFFFIIFCYLNENNYMLCALSVNILYKQQINRTFIERGKKNINKKIQKNVSN